MNAEIITIGDELLIGQVVDTNSSWLGKELSKNGVKVCYKTTVGDKRQDILDAFKLAESRCDIIFITGGLGPTKDDETKPALCEFFDTHLIKNDEVLKYVTQIFENRNLPLLEANLNQCYLPENCEVLWNDSGTAPGMWFNKNNKIFISMPGVPFEMQSIFTNYALPKILDYFKLPAIHHRTIQTISIGESFLAEKLEQIENDLPAHIRLAYLPNIGTVRLRLSAYGENKEALINEVNLITEKIYDTISSYIFGEGEDTIEQVIGILLNNNSETLSIAESCTGGYVSHLITNNPGSSAYYMGSVISYSNIIKINELSVDPNTINNYGAVSEQCVIEMANGIRKKFNTTYGIATSGIAGPGGGTKEKPIGTIWIAISSPNGTFAKQYNMGNNRERNIQKSALQALDMLRKTILKTN